jgi:hypothetical protein
MTIHTITWPKQESITFYGRNGTVYCCGIDMLHLPSSGQNGRVMLTPHTSRGEATSACNLDLPADPILLMTVASALNQLAEGMLAEGKHSHLAIGRAEKHRVEFMGIEEPEKEKA